MNSECPNIILVGKIDKHHGLFVEWFNPTAGYEYQMQKASRPLNVIKN